VTTNGSRNIWKGYLRELNREIVRTKNLSRKVVYKVEKNLNLEYKQIVIGRRI